MPGQGPVSTQHTVVFERWWEQHSELDQLVEAATDALSSGSRFRSSEALEDLAVALESHLAVEEDVYFPLLERLLPETAPGIRAALEAHEKLRHEIGRMRSELTRFDLTSVQDGLGRLLQTFHEHEKHEARMVAPLRTIV